MLKNNTVNSILPDDERLLLSKISLGDESAFRIMFNRYREKVYHFSFKIIRSDILAEEILHDVFLKIWLHQNLTEIENLEAYLRVITRNTTLKVLRRLKLETLINLQRSYSWEEAHNDTEESILLNESAQILNNAVARLSPQQKLVYALCKEEGLKYAQVAERLSISPFTVKNHMQHILRSLRSYMSKHSGIALYLVVLQLFK